MTDLIERLEASEGADRELSREETLALEPVARATYNRWRSKWTMPEWDDLDLPHRIRFMAMAKTFVEGIALLKASNTKGGE
jgi:hypothetical protein